MSTYDDEREWGNQQAYHDELRREHERDTTLPAGAIRGDGMRTREEIENTIAAFAEKICPPNKLSVTDIATMTTAATSRLQLEVLLDIRDQLVEQNRTIEYLAKQSNWFMECEQQR